MSPALRGGFFFFFEGNGILLMIAEHPRAHNRHLGGTWKILASVNVVIFYAEATAELC